MGGCVISFPLSSSAAQGAGAVPAGGAVRPVKGISRGVHDKYNTIELNEYEIQQLHEADPNHILPGYRYQNINQLQQQRHAAATTTLHGNETTTFMNNTYQYPHQYTTGRFTSDGDALVV